MTAAYIESADYYVITKDDLFKLTMNICFIILMIEKVFKHTYLAYVFWTKKYYSLKLKILPFCDLFIKNCMNYESKVITRLMSKKPDLNKYSP